ncbi:MAG: sialate O-acetylesterase [Deltaproteobacteria bacterium]
MKKIFSILFVLILLSPTAVWLIQPDFGIEVQRIGLKPPRLDSRALFNDTYYRSFDQYFNDSFSMRSLLIFAKRWLDYRLFHMTDADEVHVGTDGWLYSRKSIDDYRKEACSEKQDIEQLVLALHATERLIAATGRRFYFIVAPNKSTIYPEYVGSLPNSPSCNSNKYDYLLKEIETNTLKNFVRLDLLLKNTKKHGALLYDPAGRFWNKRGAREAAGAIYQHIFRNSANKPVWNYTVIGHVNSDDLKSQLMGLSTAVEQESVKHLLQSGQPGLPNGIIYGDDFIQNQLVYLQQMFNRLDVVRADSFPSRQHEEDLRAYDIILLERAESALDTMQIEIDKIFSNFEGETFLPLRQPIDLQTAIPGSNVSLRQQSAGLQIKSVGHQSSFKLLSLPASGDHIFRVLKLTITSPHTDRMEIECARRQPYLTHKILKPGITALYLPLPFQQSISLNIHPGDKPGVFMLHSAEVIEFPDSFDVTEPQQKKTNLAQIKPEERLTQSPPETNSSVTDSKVRSSESNSKTAPSAESELARLNRFSVKPTIPDKTDLSKTMEMDPSDSVSKRAIDRTAKSATAAKSGSMPVESAATGSPSINLNDFASGRIFQRKHRSADIVVSGTYTAPMEAIEARVVKDGTADAVVPWTVIDAAPQNGIFVGTLSGVPQGGWYNLQVRSATHPGISSHGTRKWGVGILVACLGQSNMKEWFYTGTDLVANPLLQKFNEKGWSGLGRQGNAAIAFGNKIIEHLGIPLGLLDYSKNGSGLRKEADWGTGYWEDTAAGSIYNRFVSGVSETGGAIEFVIWIQGEADAARGTVTEKEYAASLERFIIHQVRADITNSSDFDDLPFLIVMMIKRPGGKDKPHQAIRNAQKHVTETVKSSYLAATTLDLKNHGRQHLTPKAYVSLGHRVAQTILHLLGEETYHRGPSVTRVTQIDSQTIDIRIQHNGGSDFTPASGITGWEVISRGAPVPITDVYRLDPRTIRIRLQHPLNGKAQIRYLYGAMPDVRHPVFDNSHLPLPLEEYQAEINSLILE